MSSSNKAPPENIEQKAKSPQDIIKITAISEVSDEDSPEVIDIADTEERKFIKSEIATNNHRTTAQLIHTRDEQKPRHVPKPNHPGNPQDYRLDDLSDVNERVIKDGLGTIDPLLNKLPRQNMLSGSGADQRNDRSNDPQSEWGTLGDALGKIHQIDLLRLILVIMIFNCIIAIIIDATVVIPLQGLFTIILTIATLITLILVCAEVRDFLARMDGTQKRLCHMNKQDMILCFMYNTDKSFRAQDMRLLATPIIRSPNLPRNKSIRINVMKEIMKNPKTFHCHFKDSDTYGRRTYIDICIQGVTNIPALLDSGSTSSVIDMNYLNQIESKLGYRLPRINVSTRLIGFLEDHNARNAGCVSMDISIENQVNDKQMIMHNVPVYIAEGSSSRFILGQNVISQTCSVLGLTGPEPYVTLKHYPEFGKADVQYLHNDVPCINLGLRDDMSLNPREARLTVLRVQGSNGRNTDLDHKPIYLTDKIGNGSDTHKTLDFPDTIRLKRGAAKLVLRNTTKEPLYIPANDVLFSGTLLHKDRTADVTPVITAVTNYQHLDPKDYEMCPCQLKDTGEVAFIADHLGYTYQGPTLRSVFENRDLEPYNAGVYKDGNYFYLVPGDRLNFEPLNKSPVEDIQQKWTFKNNTIYICFGEHALLTDALLEFLQKLNKYSSVKLAQLNEKDYCQTCQAQSLSTLLKYKELKHTKRVNILFPTHYAIKSDSKRTQKLIEKIKSTEEKRFILINNHCPADLYISGPHEVTLFIHIPIKLTGEENIMTELTRYILAELSHVFPRATINLFTNAPRTHVVRDWILTAFKLSRYFYYFPEAFRPEATRRWNFDSDERTPADLIKADCRCSLCAGKKNDNNAYEFHQISSDIWPSMSLEESLAAPSDVAKSELANKALRKLVQLQQPRSVAAIFEQDAPPVDRPAYMQSTQGPLNEKEFMTPDHMAKSESILDEDEVTPSYPRQITKLKKRQVFEVYDDNSIKAEVNTQYDADINSPDEYMPLRDLTMDDLLDPGPHKNYDNVQGQYPLPLERRKAISISDIDDYIDFTKVNSNKLINALRLFLFSYRDVLLLDKEYDFSFIRVIAAKLYPKPECIGKAYHSRPYPATNDMLDALNVFVEKKLAQGVFTHSSKGLTCHSYSAFLVVKNSDVRMANKIHAKSDLQKLEAPPEKKWRFVVDASLQQQRLLDNYNQSILRSLNHLSIGDHISKGTNNRGRGIISTCDVGDAFGRVIVSADSRRYNGVSLPGGIYQSVPLIQGSYLSPSIFVQSLNRALTNNTKQVTLAYMDDLLINNDVITHNEGNYPEGTRVLLHSPSCNDLECNACHYIYQDDYEMDRAKVDKDGQYINTFKPHDMNTYMATMAQLDYEQLLPIQEMAISYFSPGASLDKGQQWEDTVNKLNTCPTYEVEKDEGWSDEEIRNHFINLNSLFSDLRNAGISVSATKDKLQLFRARLKYFGHYYSTSEVELTQDRKDYFEHYRAAENVKQARQFCGAINFIAGFAPDIPYLLRPLNCSLGLPDKEPLNELQKNSINIIIDRVQNIKGLPLLPSDAQLVVFTDSSLLATGIVAGFLGKKGEFNPTIFYSKNFDCCVTRSTSAIEREFLGIAMFLKLHPEATQRRKRTVFVTDSRGVHLLWTSEKVNTLTSRIGRAVLYLKAQPLNIRIIHRPSTHPGIVISDALSRELNGYYMAQDSQVQQKAAADLQERKIHAGSYKVDHSNLLPKDLVEQDMPIENLDTLYDLYMRGFMTKVKKYSQDSFEDVVNQMHNNQFPIDNNINSMIETTYKNNEHKNEAGNADHRPILNTRSVQERHQWCDSTCGATKALENEFETLEIGDDKLIRAIHAKLTNFGSYKTSVTPHRKSFKYVNAITLNKGKPIKIDTHINLGSRQPMASPSSPCAKTARVKQTKEQHNVVTKKNAAACVEKAATLDRKIGFFEITVNAEQKPVESISESAGKNRSGRRPTQPPFQVGKCQTAYVNEASGVILPYGYKNDKYHDDDRSLPYKHFNTRIFSSTKNAGICMIKEIKNNSNIKQINSRKSKDIIKCIDKNNNPAIYKHSRIIRNTTKKYSDKYIPKSAQKVLANKTHLKYEKLGGNNEYLNVGQRDTRQGSRKQRGEHTKEKLRRNTGNSTANKAVKEQTYRVHQKIDVQIQKENNIVHNKNDEARTSLTPKHGMNKVNEPPICEYLKKRQISPALPHPVHACTHTNPPRKQLQGKSRGGTPSPTQLAHKSMKIKEDPLIFPKSARFTVAGRMTNDPAGKRRAFVAKREEKIEQHAKVSRREEFVANRTCVQISHDSHSKSNPRQRAGNIPGNHTHYSHVARPLKNKVTRHKNIFSTMQSGKMSALNEICLHRKMKCNTGTNCLEEKTDEIKTSGTYIPTAHKNETPLLSGNAYKVFISTLSSLREITEEEVAANLRGINPIQYFDPTKIQKSQQTDPKYKKIINMLLTMENKKIPAKVRAKYFMLPTNLLAEKYGNELGYRIIIPTEAAVLLVAAAHGNSHLSTKNVYNLLRTYFKISHLSELATMVSHSCMQCAYNRTSTKKEQISGHALRGKCAADVISVDHMFLLPNSRHNKTYKYLFTYADTFTKMVTAVPTQTTNTKEVVEVLRQMFIINGKPNVIVSDKGSAFTSASYETFMQNEGVKAINYLSYMPKGHLIERFNLMISQVINIIMTSHHTKNWLAHIVQINDILRAMPQTYHIKLQDGTTSSTIMSAYEFTYGTPPPRSLDTQIKELFVQTTDDKERMRIQREIHEAAALFYNKQNEDQQKADELYAEKHQGVEEGSYVLLKRAPSHKYSSAYHKLPYKVTHIKGRQIGLVDPWAEHLKPFTVHIHRIKRLNVNSSLFAELPSELRIALGAADSLFQNKKDNENVVLPLQSVLRMRRGKPRREAKKPRPKPNAASVRRSLRDTKLPKATDLGDISDVSSDSDDALIGPVLQGPGGNLIPLANIQRQAQAAGANQVLPPPPLIQINPEQQQVPLQQQQLPQQQLPQQQVPQQQAPPQPAAPLQQLPPEQQAQNLHQQQAQNQAQARARDQQNINIQAPQARVPASLIAQTLRQQQQQREDDLHNYNQRNTRILDQILRKHREDKRRAEQHNATAANAIHRAVPENSQNVAEQIVTAEVHLPPRRDPAMQDNNQGHIGHRPTQGQHNDSNQFEQGGTETRNVQPKRANANPATGVQAEEIHIKKSPYKIIASPELQAFLDRNSPMANATSSILSDREIEQAQRQYEDDQWRMAHGPTTTPAMGTPVRQARDTPFELLQNISYDSPNINNNNIPPPPTAEQLASILNEGVVLPIESGQPHKTPPRPERQGPDIRKSILKRTLGGILDTVGKATGLIRTETTPRRSVAFEDEIEISGAQGSRDAIGSNTPAAAAARRQAPHISPDEISPIETRDRNEYLRVQNTKERLNETSEETNARMRATLSRTRTRLDFTKDMATPREQERENINSQNILGPIMDQIIEPEQVTEQGANLRPQVESGEQVDMSLEDAAAAAALPDTLEEEQDIMHESLAEKIRHNDIALSQIGQLDLSQEVMQSFDKINDSFAEKQGKPRVSTKMIANDIRSDLILNGIEVSTRNNRAIKKSVTKALRKLGQDPTDVQAILNEPRARRASTIAKTAQSKRTPRRSRLRTSREIPEEAEEQVRIKKKSRKIRKQEGKLAKLNLRIPIAQADEELPQSLLSSLPRLRRHINAPERYSP